MVEYFQNVQIPPRPDQGWEKRCGVSGFFPKCTKYNLVFFDTLVRLVFFSLPTLANSQGFAYNLTSNFHEIQLPNRNVSGLGFRAPEKFCESSPLWRHVFLGKNYIFNFATFVDQHFLQGFLVDQQFLHCIFCWSTFIHVFWDFFVDQQFLQGLFCWSIFFARFFVDQQFWHIQPLLSEVQRPSSKKCRWITGWWDRTGQTCISWYSESLFESLLTMNDSWNNHSSCVGNIWFQPQKANYWCIELFLQPFWLWRNTTLKGIMEFTYPNGRRIFKRERLLANFKARYAHLGLDVVEQVTRVQYGCDASIHIYITHSVLAQWSNPAPQSFQPICQGNCSPRCDKCQERVGTCYV